MSTIHVRKEELTNGMKLSCILVGFQRSFGLEIERRLLWISNSKVVLLYSWVGKTKPSLLIL